MRQLFVTAAFPILCLLGCFNPDLSQVVFTCSEQSQACPPGQQCISGKCITPPDPTTDLSAAADLALIGDMQPEDLGAADLAMPKGCANGLKFSAPVGVNTWACLGQWSAGKAPSLCAAGFAPCKSGATVDVPTCTAIKSYFFVLDSVAEAIDVPACGTKDPTKYLCGEPLAKVNVRLRYGCGGLVNFIVRRSCGPGCFGLPDALSCLNAPNDYNCDYSPFSADFNQRGDVGVLCCKS